MKRVISLVLILVFAFSLAACRTNSEAEAASAIPAEAETDDQAEKITPEPAVTPEPTEEPAVTPEPTEEPAPEPVVPEGYDAHDYLALLGFFGTKLEEFDWTIGEMCYHDYVVTFNPADPSTWHSSYQGVTWDETGHAKEISFYPGTNRFPVGLDLTGFENLKKIMMINVAVESVNIADCPSLDGESMIYVMADGEINISAGYIEQLNAETYSHVHCSLKGEDGQPFVLDLTAEGKGTVTAGSALIDGKYVIRAYARPDEYIEFVGWYDENGSLVTNEWYLPLSGDGIGKISGEHVLTAKFANPAAPTPLTEGDYFCEIKPDVEASVDIDGDGRNDTVLVKVGSEAPDGSHLGVEITLAAKPNAPYVFDAGEGHSLFAAAVDMDVSDNHIEVILCYDQCDGDPVTYVYRLRDDGSDFDVFIKPIDVGNGLWAFDGVAGDYVYNAEEGLPFSIRTEILGTYFVFNHFTVTADGIEFMDDEFTYRWASEMELKKAIAVTLEDGRIVTLGVGTKLKAYSTDRKTFVKVQLSDGRIARIEVSFGNTDYDFPVLLNGENQDAFFDTIPYAD